MVVFQVNLGVVLPPTKAENKVSKDSCQGSHELPSTGQDRPARRLGHTATPRGALHIIGPVDAQTSEAVPCGTASAKPAKVGKHVAYPNAKSGPSLFRYGAETRILWRGLWT